MPSGHAINLHSFAWRERPLPNASRVLETPPPPPRVCQVLHHRGYFTGWEKSLLSDQSSDILTAYGIISIATQQMLSHSTAANFHAASSGATRCRLGAPKTCLKARTYHAVQHSTVH